MARLIDAMQTVIKMSGRITPLIQMGANPTQVYNEVLQVVAEAPTVDAVELPCKIGDKVYRIDDGNYSSDWKPFVQELTVTEISWKKEKYGSKDLGFAIIANGIRYKFTSIGKSVFLTRKEAEAKLGGDGNG